jgi:hypothetical protein
MASAAPYSIARTPPQALPQARLENDRDMKNPGYSPGASEGKRGSGYGCCYPQCTLTPVGGSGGSGGVALDFLFFWLRRVLRFRDVAEQRGPPKLKLVLQCNTGARSQASRSCI